MNGIPFRKVKTILEKEQFSSMLHKIHQKIIQAQNQPIPVKPSVRFITWVTKAAAILLLPVLGILFYMFMNQKAEYTKSVSKPADLVYSAFWFMNM